LVRDISDRASPDDLAARDALQALLGSVDHASFTPQETVTVHLEALRGWVRIADKLPPWHESVDRAERAWRLIFAQQRPDLPPSAADVWNELLGPLADAAVEILYRLRTACGIDVIATNPPRRTPASSPPTPRTSSSS
jgi:hypothetical protein